MFRLAASALAMGLPLVSTAALAQQEIKVCNDQIAASILFTPDNSESGRIRYRLAMRYTPPQTPSSLVVSVRFTSVEGARAEFPGYWELRITTASPLRPVHVATHDRFSQGTFPSADRVLRALQITCN